VLRRRGYGRVWAVDLLSAVDPYTVPTGGAPLSHAVPPFETVTPQAQILPRTESTDARRELAVAKTGRWYRKDGMIVVELGENEPEQFLGSLLRWRRPLPPSAPPRPTANGFGPYRTAAPGATPPTRRPVHPLARPRLERLQALRRLQAAQTTLRRAEQGLIIGMQEAWGFQRPEPSIPVLEAQVAKARASVTAAQAALRDADERYRRAAAEHARAKR
jgi:hypothetical protein